jgi:hypothetical protein
MPSDRTRDYQVGYKKPPIETRFKKGNNANPRGRPRGSKNLATLQDRALDTVVVVEDGTRRRLTKRDIVIAQLVDRSAGADLRATKILLDMLDKLGRRASPGSAGAGPEDEVLSSSGQSSRDFP